MSKPHFNQKYTDEDLQKEALKFSNKRDWRKYDRGYSQAWERGILNQICTHMDNPKIKWTKDSIFASLARYSTFTEWRHSEKSAYTTAIKLGILTECRKKIYCLKKKWTVELVYEETKKYTSLQEWRRGSVGSYNFWRRNRNLFVTEIACTKKTKRDKYSNEEILALAKKMERLSDWGRHPASQAARKRVIYTISTSHMKGTRSVMEMELMRELRKNFPDAQRSMFKNDIWPDRPYIKRFELDIYIPSLGLGVEFDGTYYHSLPSLKKNRQNWPEDQISRYHEVKDLFFKEKGIQVFHVAESCWKDDRQATLSQLIKCLYEISNGKK